MVLGAEAHDGRPGMEGHPIGKRSQRKAFVLSSGPFSVLGTIGLVGGAYYVLPADVSTGPALDLAIRWLFVAMLPYAAVCLVIHRNRLNEGSHNPLADPGSDALKIHCRVMQNTLEQLVWFACCLLPLSTVLKPGETRLIPILACAFVLARLAYWRGYFVDGTLGRRRRRANDLDPERRVIGGHGRAALYEVTNSRFRIGRSIHPRSSAHTGAICFVLVRHSG